MKPTAEQSVVVESEAADLFVAAAAGSGKTRVLVDRFLRLVDGGLQPDQILTITYTRRAAAQMKERIVGRLRETGKLDAAQIAETGPIQTIHGFCERLLRENAVAAGIDPEFEIIDGSALAGLTASALASALSLRWEDEEDREDAEILDLLRLMAGRRGGKAAGEGDSPHRRLTESVGQILTKLRGTSHTVDDVAALGADGATLLRSWTAHLLEGLPPGVRAGVPAEGSLYERLTTAYKASKLARPAWLKPSPMDDLQAATHTAALLRLAARVWRRLEREMLRRHRFDFTLLERLGVELVASSEAVRSRLSRQYRVVFVDEAQDLNPMQYRLLNALRCGERMLVGDEQQSIYGFRLADVELFRRHPHEAQITPLPLSRNFRSGPGILAFVDELFSKIWADYRPMSDEGKVIYLEDAQRPSFEGVELWPFETRDTAAVAKHIQTLVFELAEEGRHAKEICVLVRTSLYGVDLLRRLERLGVRARLAGGTERYFTRMEIRDVANTLRALVNPRDDFSLIASLRSPFAGISLDAVVILSAPGQEGSVFDRLGSGPTLPEADREIVDEYLRWFVPLSAYADRLAAWEAISELYASSPFLVKLAARPNHAQLLANVRKLLALAAGTPEMGPAEFAEQVRETQRLGHKEGEAPVDDEDADGVTIMTIHKSKGLEFPVVVVPETDVKLDTRRWGGVQVDARLPMIAAQFPGTANLFAEFLAHRAAEHETEELWRVLYVALTRAQGRLCVVIDPKGRSQTLGGRVARHVGFKPDAPPLGVRVRELGRQ